MLRFLFPRLTRDENRGGALFAAVVAEAREAHWFTAGGVRDTIDGRFAVLSTLVALTTVRLEHCGEEGTAASVALAERFIEAMDAEHRELGLGDPTLGKTVRKLMGSLAGRVELWREVSERGGSWSDAAAESLRNRDADPAAIAHCEQALRRYWGALEASPLVALGAGRIG